MSKQQMVTQFSVMVSNVPGRLAQLSRILAEEGVRIDAFCALGAGDAGSISFVVGSEHGLRARLENAGFSVLENQVFRLELADGPVDLDLLAKRLAKEEINILSLYGCCEDGRASIVLSVDRPDQAAPLMALIGSGFAYSA